MAEKITCAILAGGKAERLPNKQFLLLNGRPLVSHVVGAACGYFSEVLIVAKNQGQKSKIEEFAGNKIHNKAKVILDNSEDFSPWSGIRAAVESAKAEWIFLLACDMPFVCAELFGLLVSKINPDADCIIPLTDRLQPLCALYRKSVLERAPLGGSVTRFAESLKKETVQINGPAWLLNINTKEDFEKAQKICGA